MKEVGDEIAAIKEVTKQVTSVTWAQEHRLTKDALTREREVEMELLKEREKTLGGSLASVKKELAGMKVENASF